MSAEKRPADDDPGLSKVLVKRQNVNTSEGALARLNASSSALVQAVRYLLLLKAFFEAILTIFVRLLGRAGFKLL
jgi:Prp8 binding protein